MPLPALLADLYSRYRCVELGRSGVQMARTDLRHSQDRSSSKRDLREPARGRTDALVDL